jgi:hypothetical protein
MNEAIWLKCDDPKGMLAFLGRASHRKLRLFAVACCRSIWGLFTEQRSRAAVEVAERYADGLASADELRQAEEAAWDVYRDYGSRIPFMDDPGVAVGLCLHTAAVESASRPQDEPASHRQRGCRPRPWTRLRLAQLAEQCRLLRDLFDPFRSGTVSPVWLTWNSGLVIRLAQAAYDERQLPAGTLDKDRLAVLADALEEAGCEDVEILGHLRSGGDHVRGCWLIDLLLGKG